ncbi:MAG: hypothetical protein M0P71_18595 [Melioribacteraceae bacterium]|nr:hypothetical protein [Melioribacteraceae bacterium]
MNEDNIYISLDDARAEIARRYADVELRKKVKAALGDKYINFFSSKKPKSVLFRQLISPDNGLEFFIHSANYISTEPMVTEYLDDKFVSFNEEKKAYGKLRILYKDQESYVYITDFNENERKKIREVSTLDGNSLVDFHHNLLKMADYKIDVHDISSWIKLVGTVEEYYYYYFLHFISEGVLFETFFIEDEDNDESKFTRNIILPNIKRIEKEFSLKPLIVKMYPDNQSEEDDAYWWRYPEIVNRMIVELIKKNSFYKVVKIK